MEIQRIQQKMREQKLDALIATAHDTVFYLTKAYNIPSRSFPTRLSAVLIPADGEPVLVACEIQRPLAEKSSKIRSIRYYREYIDSPSELVAGIIKNWGLDSARIGIEKVTLSAMFYDEFRALLPHAEFIPADALTAGVRMVKTPEEIDLLSRSAYATDIAIRKAFLQAKPGVMEREIQNQLGIQLLAAGADSIDHITCGAGKTSALSHPRAEMRPLESGETIRTDTGGVFAGYMSDLARTVIVGEASAEQNEYWALLYGIQTRLISEARPGVKAEDLHKLCLELFAQHGLIFAYTITGHALGLGQHDHPIIGPNEEIVLEENMVLNFEPAHRNLGAIMHIEDTVLVTPEGGKILSRCGDWSKLNIS